MEATLDDNAYLLTQSLPVSPTESHMQKHASQFSRSGLVCETRGSINHPPDTMSEGGCSYGSDSMVSSIYPSVETKVYGAMAMTPSGSLSKVLLTDYDAFPVSVQCSNCEERVVTNVQYKYGRLTWVSSVVFGILFCGVGCLVPCCVKSLKDAYHKCPKCGKMLGVYKRTASCVH